MAYVLAISDKVVVPLRFKLNDNGRDVEHHIKLVCDRLTPDQVKEATNGGETLISDFLKKVTTDWKDQRLVLDDEKKPAPFSADTFDLLLTVPGVATLAYQQYFREVTAKEKN